MSHFCGGAVWAGGRGDALPRIRDATIKRHAVSSLSEGAIGKRFFMLRCANARVHKQMFDCKRWFLLGRVTAVRDWRRPSHCVAQP